MVSSSRAAGTGLCMSAGAICAVAAIVAAIAGCGRLSFTRNPTLRLLQSDQDGGVRTAEWAPDGNTIYSLTNRYDRGLLGQVWAMRPDGSEKRCVLVGNFGSVCVSPDGSKLAVTTSWPAKWGRLLLIDTSGLVMDTLTDPTLQVVGARFGGHNDSLYYAVNSHGFFRLDIGSRRLDTILLKNSDQLGDFDIWHDSLLLSGKRIYNLADGSSDTTPWLAMPRFHPSDPSQVLGYAHSWAPDFTGDLAVFNRSTKSLESLNARPYSHSEFTSCCWSPDGRVITFSVTELKPSGGFYYEAEHDLWACER